jgi:hypothetical protein
MANPTKANIMKSGAVLWYAPLGTALPAITTLGAGVAWASPWARVGFTSEPLKLLYEDERMDVEVDEQLAPLEDWRTKEMATLETVLAEVIADYIQLLTGGTVTTGAAGTGVAGYEQLDIGGFARVTQYAVGFEGIRYDANSNALPQRALIPIASFKLNGEMEYSKKSDSYLKLPIQIKGFGDPANGGRVIRWQRVTAPAT